MDKRTSRAYEEYNRRAEEAAKIAADLRSLYGCEKSAEAIMIRARIDGIITEQERDLIRRFHSL